MLDMLLSVEGLKMVFENKVQSFTAVDELSFSIKRGETLGIVGESGSGKTMSSLSVMRLLPNQGRITDGKVIFEGNNILTLNEKEMYKIRGNKISMIFQDPMMSLDQVYTVGFQIVEALKAHKKISKIDAEKKALNLLESVGIPHPERVFRCYPFELSGGMCQRIMIAIALSCRPKLLFADEPTTALDVTVQAQILDLLKKMQKEYEMGIVLITHDLGVVADIADRILVMYAGKSMENATTNEIFNKPLHPYTVGLMKSIPHLDTENHRLYSINGTVPDIRSMPKGCRFCTRCPFVINQCNEKEPEMKEVEKGHFVRCFRAEEILKGELNIE
ncbi:MAG: ABC transporter ATP-binding protein [Clostridium beijerinckii]